MAKTKTKTATNVVKFKKPKQHDLPAMQGKGVAALKIPELDRLAEVYCTERDKRLRLTPKEVAAKRTLEDAMLKHSDELKQPDGTLLYRYDERRIIAKPGKMKLRVEDVTSADEE